MVGYKNVLKIYAILCLLILPLCVLFIIKLGCVVVIPSQVPSGSNARSGN